MSTHGYSQNQILVWKYPSLTQVAKLTGHSYRVLYLVSLPSRPKRQYTLPPRSVIPSGPALGPGTK